MIDTIDYLTNLLIVGTLEQHGAMAYSIVVAATAVAWRTGWRGFRRGLAAAAPWLAVFAAVYLPEEKQKPAADTLAEFLQSRK